jgi:hypothetical protein
MLFISIVVNPWMTKWMNSEMTEGRHNCETIWKMEWCSCWGIANVVLQYCGIRWLALIQWWCFLKLILENWSNHFVNIRHVKMNFTLGIFIQFFRFSLFLFSPSSRYAFQIVSISSFFSNLYWKNWNFDYFLWFNCDHPTQNHNFAWDDFNCACGR